MGARAQPSNQSSSCGEYQVTMLVGVDSISFIRVTGKSPLDFISDDYKCESLRETCSYDIHHVTIKQADGPRNLRMRDRSVLLAIDSSQVTTREHMEKD
jgi:hypothetical protein